jgi:predicted ATP-dependent serine protease
VSLCRTCGDRPAKVKGQCRACYVYELRTGKDRSDYLARVERRREEARDRAWFRMVERLQMTGV